MRLRAVGWVAVGDYNGNLIYDISQDGTSKQIDTNLPVKSLSVAANGVVAAILEDGGCDLDQRL